MENNTIIETVEKSLNRGVAFSTQLKAFELYLNTKKAKGKLKQCTIDVKLNQLSLFLIYLQKKYNIEKGLGSKTINIRAFEYVRDGSFTTPDKEGSFLYRKMIHYNLKEGWNFLMQDKTEYLIEELTEEQLESLEMVSINNWVVGNGVRDVETKNESIQVELIKSLGLKVYFDEANEPYVLSNELADMIGKRHDNVLKDLRGIVEKVADLQALKIEGLHQTLGMTMFEDSYTYNLENGGTKTVVCYRLKKDLLFNYVLGLNGDKYFKFKVEYQMAFNFIEKKYKEELIENATIKDILILEWNEGRKEKREREFNFLNKIS